MLWTYFQLGYHHLTEAGAWDHQLFLLTLALAYAPALWRKWIALATAFAVGHTFTLALGANGLLPIQMCWVEPSIAASILTLSLVDLGFLQYDPYGLHTRSLKYSLTLGLALAFGCIHGLGFAGAFGSMLFGSVSAAVLTQMLAAFTLGVEVAQLLILLGFWIIGYLLLETLQFRPLLLRKLLLVIVVLLSTKLFFSALAS